MSDRKQSIQETLKKLYKIKVALDEVYQLNQGTIQSLSWYNSRIKHNMHDIAFAQELYGSFSESELNNIPETAYSFFIKPLENLITAGSSYFVMKNDMIQVRDHINQLSSSLASSTGLVSIATGDTAANVYSLSGSVVFNQPRIYDIVKKYLAELRTDDDVNYIKAQLPNIQPDISKDFQHFLDNYYASEPTPSKFQELIGCRSLIFFKLIFAVADRYGVSRPTRTRREQIAAFVYGKNPTVDRSVEETIEAAKDLWDELSDQDPSGYSVKTGNVTPEYVELIFNKIVIVLSILLKQREIHFKP